MEWYLNIFELDRFKLDLDRLKQMPLLHLHRICWTNLEGHCRGNTISKYQRIIWFYFWMHKSRRANPELINSYSYIKVPAVVSVFANLTFTSNRILGRVQVLYKHVRGRGVWPEMLTMQKFGIGFFGKFNTRFELKFSRILQAIFCSFCLINRPKISVHSE